MSIKSKSLLLIALIPILVFSSCDILFETFYTVTYFENGADSGIVPFSQTETVGDAIFLAYNFGELARTGYSFVGWNTSPDGSGLSYDEGEEYIGFEDVNLYAQWSAESYLIRYLANGADSGQVPSSQSKDYGVDVTLRFNENGLARTGYTFIGWNTQANGGGTAYAEGATYSVDADSDFYAHWTDLPTYVISYDGNGNTGGTAPPEQIKLQHEGIAIGNSGNLEKTGHSFLYWNTAADGSGITYETGSIYSVNSDLILYAIWAVNQYSLVYENSGSTTGTAPETLLHDFGSLVAVADQGTLQRDGYDFIAWNTNIGGSGLEYLPGDTITIPAADVTLYPQWEKSPVTLTLGQWHQANPENVVSEWFRFDSEPGKIYQIHTHDAYFTHPDAPGAASYDNELGAYRKDKTTSYNYLIPGGQTGQQDIYGSLEYLELEALEDQVYIQATQYGGGSASGSHWIKVLPILDSYNIAVTVEGNGYVERRVGGILNDGPYPEGTEVELTAIARDSDAFLSWAGALSGSANPQTLTVTSFTEVTAQFTGTPVQPAIVPVIFNPVDTSAMVDLFDLSGKSVYLVKANHSIDAASEAAGVQMNIRPSDLTHQRGIVREPTFAQRLAQLGITEDEVSGGNLRYVDQTGRFILDRSDVLDLDLPGGSASAGNFAAPSRSLRGLEKLEFVAGDSKTFWVDDGPNGQPGVWEQITATLRAVGDNSYIWVHDATYDALSSSGTDNKITQAQAELLRDNFEILYPMATSLFGYELGGGPGGDGGMDSDSRISILLYDVADDYAADQTGGILGYFWGKDAYTQAFFDGNNIDLKSNEAEIFYIDTHFADFWPEGIVSTLAHEYQHMIHFAQKALAHNVSSPAWTNEMLSMLAEDYLSETLGTTLYSSHPSGRINQYNPGYYNSGIVDWNNAPGEDVLESYASAYLFGAFLARNYGGAELIHELATNAAGGIASIEMALSTLGYSETFDDVVAEYTKLHVFPTAHPEISRDFIGFTETYDGTTYNIATFDLFAVDSGPQVLQIGSSSVNSIRPYGFQVWSQASWQNLSSATLSIELLKPDSDDVRVYIMIK